MPGLGGPPAHACLVSKQVQTSACCLHWASMNDIESGTNMSHAEQKRSSSMMICIYIRLPFQVMISIFSTSNRTESAALLEYCDCDH